MSTQIIVVEKGSVGKADKTRLENADIFILEVSDLSKVRLLNLESPVVTGNDLAECAIHALAYNDSASANSLFIKSLSAKIKERAKKQE